MRKLLLTGMGVLLFVLGYWMSEIRVTRAYAANPIPKEWGAFRGGSSQLFYFESNNGTIRVYNASQGRVVVTLNRN